MLKKIIVSRVTFWNFVNKSSRANNNNEFSKQATNRTYPLYKKKEKKSQEFLKRSFPNFARAVSLSNPFLFRSINQRGIEKEFWSHNASKGALVGPTELYTRGKLMKYVHDLRQARYIYIYISKASPWKVMP